MKGIVLAGGTGSRLFPLTMSVSKQLLPVFDKPMIYYPMAVLMHAGIRDVLIISTPHDKEAFERLLGDGSAFGIEISYAAQPKPEGIAQAFIIGEEFIDNEPCALILGDNIFHGGNLIDTLDEVRNLDEGAAVFGYKVHDPERYGVVELDYSGRVLSIEEKPEIPKSNYALAGLYFYDSQVVSMAKRLKPSARGELEITDINQEYLNKGKLHVKLFRDGVAWLDTGTHVSLQQASNYIQTIQERQGVKVACLEEIAYDYGYIDAETLAVRAAPMGKNDYGSYLLELAEQDKGEHLDGSEISTNSVDRGAHL